MRIIWLTYVKGILREKSDSENVKTEVILKIHYAELWCIHCDKEA